MYFGWGGCITTFMGKVSGNVASVKVCVSHGSCSWVDDHCCSTVRCITIESVVVPKEHLSHSEVSVEANF